MATSQIEAIDYSRIFAVIVGGTLVFLMRRKIFWSILGLSKTSKIKQTTQKQETIQAKAKSDKKTKELVKM